MKKRLKIIFDASPLLVNKTGVAYYIERLVTQLAAQYPEDLELVGYYFNFLGRRPATHLPQAPNIRYRPVRLLPSKVIYQLRRFGLEIPLELLTKEQGDFVLFGNFLGYPMLHKTPSAPVIHDLTYLDLPQYVSAKNQRDLMRFVPRQIKRSSFTITVSQFSQQRIHDVYNVALDDILVTHIPPEQPHKYSQADNRKTLQAAGVTGPYMLFLSTIEPRKNLVSLIDAYAALPQATRDSYMLVIAGRIGWNCQAEIERLERAKAEGLRVIHLGYVDDQTRFTLFQSAALFVMPSSYEGFGMPILEAMSYGTPCLVSDIPVFHEVAGDAVRYFDHTSAKALTGSLQTLLNNKPDRQQLGQAGKRHAQEFRWEAVASKLYDKIRQTTDG